MAAVDRTCLATADLCRPGPDSHGRLLSGNLVFMRTIENRVHLAHRGSLSAARLACIVVAWIAGLGIGFNAIAQSPTNAGPPMKNGPSGVQQIGWGAVTLPNGDVLGVGTASDGHSSLGFLYHANADRWEATARIPEIIALGDSLAVLKNGVVIAFGVGSSDRKIKAEVFDPANNQWHEAGVVPDVVGWQRKQVRVSDTRFLLLTGQAGTQWLYEAGKETWTKTTELPVQISGVQFAVPLDDGQALIVFQDTSRSQRWLGLVYDSTRDLWQPTKPMPNAMRGVPNGTKKMADGSVLMIGYQEVPTIAMVPIIFQPADQSWALAGELPAESTNARLAGLLPDGKVMAIDSVSIGTMRALIFDPARRAWKVEGALPYGYQSATVLRLLKDGTMWAMGSRSNVDGDELVYSSSRHTWTVRPMPRGATMYCPLGISGDVGLLFLAPNDGMGSLIQGAVLFRP